LPSTKLDWWQKRFSKWLVWYTPMYLHQCP
jgi:hypothetical protein